MGAKIRDRLAVGSLLLLIAGAILAGGRLTGTFALFTAETENPDAAFAGGWIPPPTDLSDSVTAASNQKVELDWTSGAGTTPPSPNPVTGQELDIADGGSGSTPSCGTYSAVATYGKNKTTVNDGGTGVPTADWWCYQMVSTSGGAWTSSAEFPPIQILVPVSIVFSGDGDGQLESGETITITFNQPVSSSIAINSGICQVKPSTVVLGFSGTCAASATYSIGKITGTTVNATGSTTASVGVSGSVVTITATAVGQHVAAAGTYVAAVGITGSSGAPAACIAPACKITPSGGF
jgi:hypothetical protein